MPRSELIKILSTFNPWWKNESIPDLPTWKRASFHELFKWIKSPPAPRAILLSGARQVGKTTLLLQAISKLISEGVPAANIIYVTLDHPIIKLAGFDDTLAAWREREPKQDGTEYIFLDEAQSAQNWDVWVKHQVDFQKSRRIIFTGSAMPLIAQQQESGVGRWHTIKLTTLSFYEYLQLKQLNKLPKLPKLKSLRELFTWSQSDIYKVAELAAPYVGHFHEYLIRGGFPQTAKVENITQAQQLLRDDIIDKVLKRDMTVLFGVRSVIELEMTFLYLCMHNGGIFDTAAVSKNLKASSKTVNNFIQLLESTHLIYRLPPYGYGKEILRARYKIYLADAAIAPAVLRKGKSAFDNPTELGAAAETCVIKHVYARYYAQSLRFTYWRDKADREVDLISEIGEEKIPFEVKYKNEKTGPGDLKGLMHFCEEKSIKHAYVATKSLDDFGILSNHTLDTKIMRVPAPLLCYWMGESELLGQAS